MLIQNTFVIEAPIQTVWDFLLDIEQMSTCVPGAERIEALDDKTYRGELQVKVGPISAAFGGRVQLVEVDPPRRLIARLDGKDPRSASMVTGTFAATLMSQGEDRTEVAYEMDVVVRGRLGRFGQGVMQEVATQLTEQFARCVQTHLEEEHEVQKAETISLAGIVVSLVTFSVRFLGDLINRLRKGISSEGTAASSVDSLVRDNLGSQNQANEAPSEENDAID